MADDRPTFSKEMCKNINILKFNDNIGYHPEKCIQILSTNMPDFDDVFRHLREIGFVAGELNKIEKANTVSHVRSNDRLHAK